MIPGNLIANAVELTVRANQKDYYYLSQLTERFEDVSRSLLGQIIQLVVRYEVRETDGFWGRRDEMVAEMGKGIESGESVGVLWLDDLARYVTIRLFHDESVS